MNAKPLPKWIMQRYALLWDSFRTKEFTFEEISHVLNEDESLIRVVVFNLKRYGWLIDKTPSLSKKRIYQLKNPEVALKDMLAFA